MDKFKIFLINASINFSNLNLLAGNEFNKFVIGCCDKCELSPDKYQNGLCRVVSKEVLFLESLVGALPFQTDDVFKNELASAGKDLINVMRLFLSARSFKPALGCDMERHLVLSKLIKISCQISEAIA